MAVTPTIYASSVAWNSSTWNASGGGPIAVTYDHSSRSEEARSGDDEYARTVFSVDKNLRATVRLQDVDVIPDIGTKSNLTATLSTKSGTKTLTMVGMVFEGAAASQDRATIGDVELRFIHESADGSTVPIS